MKMSSAARRRLNLKAASRQLELLIAANFTRRDLVVTLTYDDEHLPQSRAEAVKNLKKFFRALRGGATTTETARPEIHLCNRKQARTRPLASSCDLKRYGQRHGNDPVVMDIRRAGKHRDAGRHPIPRVGGVSRQGAARGRVSQRQAHVDSIKRIDAADRASLTGSTTAQRSNRRLARPCWNRSLSATSGANMCISNTCCPTQSRGDAVQADGRKNE